MKSFLLAFAIVALMPIATPRASAQSTAVEPIDRIAAVVDESVVLQSELDREVARVSKQYASEPQQLPPRDVLEHQLLDRLILDKLQLARAESTGVKVSDADIDQALTGIAQQNRMDVSQLRGAIQQQGIDYDQFRKGVADQLTIQRLRQRVVQGRVHISDAEVDSLIKNGRLHQGQLHLAYILINVPDGATPAQIDEAHAKANDAKKQIDGGMDFSAAAIRYSNAENALQGGDLGTRSANELPPAFVDVAAKLQDGQTADPVRGPNGFYLIKLIGKSDSGAQMVTEYHVRHILIKPSELVSSQQAEKKAEAVRKAIVAGEDFAKAAKDSSEDTATARLGGDLGWFADESAYGSKVAQVVKSLKKGEISEPFETDAGWHIVQLEDTRTTDKSGDMQRDEAKNTLFQRKAQDEYESFLRQLRSEAYVEIRLPGAASASTAAPSP